MIDSFYYNGQVEKKERKEEGRKTDTERGMAFNDW